jgi:hypothetical protein
MVATVLLLWPGPGANWFGAGGSPNDSLANLSSSHQRLQYKLSQIAPRAMIIVIGLVFYLLRKTRPPRRDLFGRHNRAGRLLPVVALRGSVGRSGGVPERGPCRGLYYPGLAVEVTLARPLSGSTRWESTAADTTFPAKPAAPSGPSHPSG